LNTEDYYSRKSLHGLTDYKYLMASEARRATPLSPRVTIS